MAFCTRSARRGSEPPLQPLQTPEGTHTYKCSQGENAEHRSSCRKICGTLWSAHIRGRISLSRTVSWQESAHRAWTFRLGVGILVIPKPVTVGCRTRMHPAGRDIQHERFVLACQGNTSIAEPLVVDGVVARVERPAVDEPRRSCPCHHLLAFCIEVTHLTVPIGSHREVARC